MKKFVNSLFWTMLMYVVGVFLSVGGFSNQFQVLFHFYFAFLLSQCGYILVYSDQMKQRIYIHRYIDYIQYICLTPCVDGIKEMKKFVNSLFRTMLMYVVGVFLSVGGFFKSISSIVPFLLCLLAITMWIHTGLFRLNEAKNLYNCRHHKSTVPPHYTSTGRHSWLFGINLLFVCENVKVCSP